MEGNSEGGDGVSREDVKKSFDELHKKLKLPSPASLKKRRAELKRQAREILKRFPPTKRKSGKTTQGESK